MRLARGPLIWAALAIAIGVPIAAAAASPLLEWRGPVYILAGFAGIVALGLILVQPLLIAGYLPGLSGRIGRRAHLWIGSALVAALRRRLGLRPRTWRTAHMLLAIVIVAGTVAHGMLIEGAMETVSKAVLCALVLAAAIRVIGLNWAQARDKGARNTR